MNMDFGIPINEEQKPQKRMHEGESSFEAQQKPQNLGVCGFLSVAYYQPYFNVTTEDVVNRLKLALIPNNPQFLQIISQNPDLWGPVWISTSLVLLFGAAGNFIRAMTEQSYDFSYVPAAAGLLYTIAFCTPTILTILMKCLGSEIQLFQTICLYGYSMTTLIPITIICTFPSQILHWLLGFLGFLSTTFFLIINLNVELTKLEQQKKYIVAGLIVGMQALLYLTFILYFFDVVSK